MRLDPDGAQLFPAAFSPGQVSALENLLAFGDRPGTRLEPLPGLAALVRPATAIAAAILGPEARPVRALLFDKSPGRNWALGWHQDRAIAVRRRVDAPGFTGWTVKAGIPHVVPPFEILARMLTLRVHLDPAGPDNAPLLIVPGSHRLGRIAEPDIAAAVDRLGQASCPAERGDLWLYATPILHASQRAARPARRRVLQLLYSADELPGGFEWLGV
ncbi:MAG TPA: phytanoyl-CoA dioxygenase family protein [Allosphingosinicella sp.]|nr:phytanoyl-CoA dioxygenase family protein [Allosphingosinicella sp.]